MKHLILNIRNLLFIFFCSCAFSANCQLNLVSQFYTGGDNNDVFVVGDYAYLADNMELNILVFSDIYNPTSVAKVDVFGEIMEIFVEGNYAYVAALTSGLTIIDISNPSNPSITSNITSGLDAEDVHVIGDKAYLANDYGFNIIDMIDPTNPKVLSSISYWPGATSITVNDSIAYVGVLWDGIKVIDISNPYSPYQVGTSSTGGYYYGGPGWAVDLHEHNGIVYFGDGHYGLYSFRLNSSMSLDSIGHYDDGYGSEIFVDNDNIYYADSDFELFDTNASGAITNPTDSYSGGYNPGQVFVSGNYIFLGMDYYGLHIIEKTVSTSVSNNPPPTSIISMYPNPVQEVLNLKLTEAKRVEVTMTDVLGRTVINQTFSNVGNSQLETIEMKHLIPGIYVVQVNVDDQIITQKVVKK